MKTGTEMPVPVRRAWWVGPFGVSWRLVGSEPVPWFQINPGFYMQVGRIRFWYWPVDHGQQGS